MKKYFEEKRTYDVETEWLEMEVEADYSVCDDVYGTGDSPTWREITNPVCIRAKVYDSNGLVLDTKYDFPGVAKRIGEEFGDLEWELNDRYGDSH